MQVLNLLFAFVLFFLIIMSLLAKHGIAFKKDKFILSNCKMRLSNPHVYFSFDLILGDAKMHLEKAI